MQTSHVGYQTWGFDVPNRYILFSTLYELTGGKKMAFLGPNVVILDPKWPCKGPYSKLYVNMSCGVPNSMIC